MIKTFFYFLVIILLFSGCDHNSNKKPKELNKSKNITDVKIKISKPQKPKENKRIITGEDFNLTFIDSKLIYPKNKMVLLFSDESLFCKEEERILKKLKISYHKTKNKFLENYFNITYYPSIVILDNNKTIIYQNFMPYEMLKTEGI